MKSSKLTTELLGIFDRDDADKVIEYLKTVFEQPKHKDTNHKCWFHIPTETEYERMKKYLPDEKCPKCGSRLRVEVYHGNMGSSWNLVCKWGNNNCDFKEYISDDE